MSRQAQPEERLSVLVNGQSLSGWKAVTIKRDVLSLAGTFELEASMPSATGVNTVAALPGSPCELLLTAEGGPSTALLNGFIEAAELVRTAGETRLSLGGRCRTADIVDCSVTHRPGDWRGQRLPAIVDTLLEPFKGVQAEFHADVGASFSRFGIQIGESVFEALQRLARARRLIITGDERGNVIFTRAGGVSFNEAYRPLVMGENLLSMRVQTDLRDRFSVYRVFGQQTQAVFDAPAVNTVSEAFDFEVRRFRPMEIVAAGDAQSGSTQALATFEARIRAAQGASVEAQVNGWRDAAGKLWKINRNVALVDEELGIDRVMLIRSVTFSLSERGMLTDLVLVDEALLTMEPMPDGKEQRSSVPFWS